jgi:hypothetical protein
MAIVRKGTLTVVTGGVAQNLALGFIPSYFRMVNKTIQTSGTVTGVTNAEWWDDMVNASAYITTYSTGTGTLSYISTNGVTPLVTPDSGIYAATNLAITGISKAANASITATHAFTAADIGVTTVSFHGVVGMTQINTLTGVIQSVTSTTSFTVNINSTNFTTFVASGTPIANVVTGNYPFALQGGVPSATRAPGFPPSQAATSQVLNAALYNQGIIGLTLGTTLMVNTSDVWEYLALLDAPFTSA